MSKKQCLVTIELGMSPEEFEAVKDDFVRDFEIAFELDPGSVKIVSVRDKRNQAIVEWKGGRYVTSSVGVFLGSATAEATRGVRHGNKRARSKRRGQKRSGRIGENS